MEQEVPVAAVLNPVVVVSSTRVSLIAQPQPVVLENAFVQGRWHTLWRCVPRCVCRCYGARSFVEGGGASGAARPVFDGPYLGNCQCGGAMVTLGLVVATLVVVAVVLSIPIVEQVVAAVHLGQCQR